MQNLDCTINEDIRINFRQLKVFNAHKKQTKEEESESMNAQSQSTNQFIVRKVLHSWTLCDNVQVAAFVYNNRTD